MVPESEPYNPVLRILYQPSNRFFAITYLYSQIRCPGLKNLYHTLTRCEECTILELICLRNLDMT